MVKRSGAKINLSFGIRQIKLLLSNSRPQVIFGIGGIIVLAGFLRIFGLGSVPVGFQWDEASYGYNAYSLWQTGKDEWGVRWPLFMQAFGEYKPALLSYLMIPFFMLGGVSELTARLPTALLGTISIAGIWGLLRSWNRPQLAWVSALVLAVMPWHIHYSRIAFDPIVSLAFMVFGLWGFTRSESWLKVMGVIGLFVSMYTYNGGRFMVPILVFLYIFIYRRSDWKSKLKNISGHTYYCC